MIERSPKTSKKRQKGLSHSESFTKKVDRNAREMYQTKIKNDRKTSQKKQKTFNTSESFPKKLTERQKCSKKAEKPRGDQKHAEMPP